MFHPGVVAIRRIAVRRLIIRPLLAAIGLLSLICRAPAADPAPEHRSPSKHAVRDQALLTPDEWRRLDRAVDRGLAFLARTQEKNGSFPTRADAQPGVSSLCVMAFLSRGHQPSRGPYGARLERAIDYCLETQDPDSGALMPDRFIGANNNGSNYSHALAGVMLAEVYGMTDANRHERIRQAVRKGLEYSRFMQLRPKGNPLDRGGWRYIQRSQMSDLSVTSCQLMFYRAARNAEFNVPSEWVKEAMDYVHRTFDTRQRAFVYGLNGSHRYVTRGMVGAGIICLELGGEHQSETARIAGDWLLNPANSFEPYNNFRNEEDRFHYGAFYSSQAMFQLGGDYWRRFFPRLLTVMTQAQHADGSWDPEAADNDNIYGNAYTTALAVLTLATPYQILPIYQR